MNLKLRFVTDLKKMVSFPIVLIGISISLSACTKDERVDRFKMLELARVIEPGVEPIIPKDLESGVRCSGLDGTPIYGPGCSGAFQVKVGPIDMIVLEFENQKQAETEAKRINQWYYKNWVFDDVTGEPYLEEFVVKAFNATYAGEGKNSDSKRSSK